jgi:hypothetical protein
VIPDVLVMLLVAALVYFVARPIIHGARREPPDAPTAEAEERKRAALTAIVDIEDEFAVGKLTRQDFDALRSQYEAEAVNALRELDAARPVSEPDDALELEIAALRAQLECPTCGGIRTAQGVCPQCRSDR